MSSIGTRLIIQKTEQESRTAKLLRALEQGGERLNDEAAGLKKSYDNKPLNG